MSWYVSTRFTWRPCCVGNSRTHEYIVNLTVFIYRKINEVVIKDKVRPPLKEKTRVKRGPWFTIVRQSPDFSITKWQFCLPCTCLFKRHISKLRSLGKDKEDKILWLVISTTMYPLNSTNGRFLYLSFKNT